MSESMSTPAQAAMDRTVESADGDDDEELASFDAACSADPRRAFETERCADWIRTNGLKRVALQFPDSLLKHAPAAATVLERELADDAVRIFVLGDTSYGECCVDEVAAEHAGADGVVHFGRACLTPVDRVPVLHVFTSMDLDAADLADKIAARSVPGRILVFYDVRYHSAFESVSDADLGDNVTVCRPAPKDTDENTVCGRLCPKEDPTEDDAVVFVGPASARLQLVLWLRFPRAGALLSYRPSGRTLEPVASGAAGREMRKRLYLVEKVKDASRIGVLVGTLAASRYRQAVDRAAETARRAGKKCYTFLVGKPNVPKLANFPEVDAFVLVACPENSLVGAREYMQPVVTPAELDLALNPARREAWEAAAGSAGMSADFRDVVTPGGRDYLELADPDAAAVADVSLVTGKVRNMELKDTAEEEASETALAARSGTEVSLLHSGGGGEFLAGKTWRGLEQKLGETDVVRAVRGRSGIAAGYSGEGQGDELGGDDS